MDGVFLNEEATVKEAVVDEEVVDEAVVDEAAVDEGMVDGAAVDEAAEEEVSKSVSKILETRPRSTETIVCVLVKMITIIFTCEKIMMKNINILASFICMFCGLKLLCRVSLILKT